MPPPPARRAREERRNGASAGPTLILAGRGLVRGRLEPIEVAIGDDGRILSVGKVRTGAPRHDLGEAVILPAATDLHVHFRDPGGPASAETLATGTAGAALGGIALVGDMPNTVPPIADAEAVREKAARLLGRAAVDVLIYAMAPRRRVDELARAAGAFKLYLSPTTATEEPVPAADVAARLAAVGAAGLPLAVHAEDAAAFRTGISSKDPAGWNAARPVEAEERAVNELDPVPSALRLHVAHVTTAEAARRLTARGVSFEATPHHLLLSERSGRDARFKVNPPLRSERERQRLWEAYRRGDVPMVASDHAPHALAEKERPFDQAPSGVPGVETLLPLLLARVRAGELPLETLVRTACDRPARWLGQPMGRVAPGHRANLIVVDFRARSPVEGRRLQSPSGWTPFEGWESIRTREHYRDGERIVEDGEYVGRPTGRVVRPEFAPGSRANY
jgi:dihydroorotase